MDPIAAHPIRSYKQTTVMLNGVTKSVVLPVPIHASGANENGPRQNDLNDFDHDDCTIIGDSECFIVDVETLELESSSESCQFLPVQSDPGLVALDTEPVEIVPSDNRPLIDMVDLTLTPEKTVTSSGSFHSAENNFTTSFTSCQFLPVQSDPGLAALDTEPVEIVPSDNRPLIDMVDLTLTPEKTVTSSGTFHSVENNFTTVSTTDTVCPVSRGATCIVTPITHHSSPDNTASIAKSVVSMEAQLADFPAATIFRCGSEYCINSPLQSEIQVDPVVIAPQPDTDVSTVSVISLPRTMTKDEALAAGWFADEGRPGYLESFSTTATSQPSKAPCDASTLLGTLPAMSSYSAEPVVRDDFVSSAELVSLENVDNDMTDGEALTSGSTSSGNTVNQQHELEIDVAVDGTPQPLVEESKLFHKFENVSNYFDEEDNCKYSAFMSEEDEPLTAVVEGMVSDNPVCENPSITEKTLAVKRRRGRPLKSALPRSCLKTVKGETNMAEQTEGCTLTAAERYRLENCGVWLQRLQLPSATVKLKAVWRYQCCHQVTPPVTASCNLCSWKQNSDSVFELEVARKFRAGSQLCKKASKIWHEFSIDSSLLPKPTARDAGRFDKSPVNKSLSQATQTSDSDCATSSEGSKKYLLIRTESGTFIVPVDGVVGCIVSEQEIAKMLSSQPVLPSSSSAGGFSKDALLTACSQLRPSHSNDSALPSNKPLCPKTQKTTASTALKKENVRQRKRGDFCNNSSPSMKSKMRVKNTGTAKRSPGRKSLSNRLVQNARRSSQRFALKRELSGLSWSLGLLKASPRKSS